MRKELKFHVVDVPAPDVILEFQAAFELVKDARHDNIWVSFRRNNGVMAYRVTNAQYKTYQGALNAVHFLQSQIAPSTEVRS